MRVAYSAGQFEAFRSVVNVRERDTGIMPGRVQDDADFELCQHFPPAGAVAILPVLGDGAAGADRPHSGLAVRERLKRGDLVA